MNNFDRLKNKRAEEFAEIFSPFGRCLPKILDGEYPNERCLKFPNCQECTVDYLKSEVTDND